MKKFLSLVLALVMVCSIAAIAASAADADAAATSAEKAMVTLYDINGNPMASGEYAVGEVITCTVYLDTSEIGTIGSIKGNQTYTSSVLTLADAYKETDGMIVNMAAMFPVTKAHTVANGKLDGKVAYNCSVPNMGDDAFHFVDGSILMQTHYTVSAAGNAEIHNELNTLAVADYNLSRIIVKGVVIDNRFKMAYTLSDPAPEEGSTVSGAIDSAPREDDTVTVQLLNGEEVIKSTTGTADYSISGVADGNYTLRFSKVNHVTRDYSITVSGDTVQDAEIRLLGDVNGDKKVTTVDFGKANAHARGKGTPLDGYDLKCADTIGGDGRVTTADAGRINSHARGKGELWPAYNPAS